MAKGYVKLNNELISGLARLKLSSPSSYMVLFAIIRNTLCYHKNQYELSNGFLEKATGLSERSVIRAIQELEGKGIIKIVSKSCGSHPRILRILTDRVVTLTASANLTDNLDSENTDNLDSINTDSPDTQEIIANNSIKEREKKEISFSERRLTIEELAAKSWAEEYDEEDDLGNL